MPRHNLLLGNHGLLGYVAHRQRQRSRRRGARLQRRLLDQMIRLRFHEAMTLHRLANATGLDYDTIRVAGVGFGAVPASVAAVADMEKQSFRATTAEGCGGAGKECSVCLEGFEDGEELSVMPCSHRFHPVCIVKWLGRSNVCPLCRHELPPAFDLASEQSADRPRTINRSP